jgi:FkbM family methyltransferase
MRVFRNKFVPASFLATFFIGRAVYNFWNPDNVAPMSRRTLLLADEHEMKNDSTIAFAFKLEKMKKEYEAKLAEQSRLHETQIVELVRTTKQQQQQHQTDQASAGVVGGERSSHPTEKDDTTTTFGAATNYQLSFYPYTLKGHEYFLPAYAMTRPAVKSFLRGKYYEEQTHCTMEKLLHRYPGSMVHAGTFFGDMIAHFSTIIQNVTTEPSEHDYKLYAFEPNTKNYLLAQMAVEANELSNVILVNAALGPSVMQQRIQVVGSEERNGGMDLGGGSAVNPHAGTQRVPQLMIDMFHITDLTVIALDTEGFEEFVLRGAMQTLKNPTTRPLVVALEDNKGTATAFMKENLPEYSLITRKSGLSYFALAKVQTVVKKLLQKNC